MTDRCEVSDLERNQCAHCGATPGTHIAGYLAIKAARVTVVRRSGRNLFPTAPLPAGHRTSRPGHGTSNGGTPCQACGRPTRDNAYGCDECADELRDTLDAVPWWAEQIEITMTKQQAKRPGAGSRSSNGLPWHEKAADIGHALRNYLVAAVKVCVEQQVRHQSPYPGLPDDNVLDMSAWLLWRVDGLTLSPAFGDILAAAQRVEENAAWLIERRPDRIFLGRCDWAQVCGGIVYALPNQITAKCRACGKEYDVAERRAELEQTLDDRLCTASEIAKLATYLGIPADRDVVRRRVNRWHNAGVIRPASWTTDEKTQERTPRFRYGDVVPRLAATYDKKGTTA